MRLAPLAAVAAAPPAPAAAAAAPRRGLGIGLARLRRIINCICLPAAAPDADSNGQPERQAGMQSSSRAVAGHSCMPQLLGPLGARLSQIFLHLDTFGSNVRKFHWVSKS